MSITGRSATGANWLHDAPAWHLVQGIVQETRLPIGLATALAGRGLGRDDMAGFLAPKIRDLMPDPSVFADMDKAVLRLAEAVKNREKIGIFGDYDVDGACSAAIFIDILTALGCEVSAHIPDRFSEGYGPNQAAFEGLRQQGCSFIVTVDCGITAHAPIAASVVAGVDVIVIDHHIAGPDLPKALAVVNPNRLDDDSGCGYLAAAGVCFMVMAGLLRHLRLGGHFEDGTTPPDLMNSLDIVALATVADVVPMIGLNRAFIRSGLAVMGRRQRLGLAALADISGLSSAPNSYALGFLLGPRINAGGRIGLSSLGVDLLTATDKEEAARLAAALDALNTRRKEIEHDVVSGSIAQLEGRSPRSVMIAAAEGWNQGVVGIAAGRVREHFNKPAAVISIIAAEDGEAIGKGSARSVGGFRLGEAIIAAQQKGLLMAGGGHDMAAGFTLKMENLAAFQDFMDACAIRQLGSAELGRQYRIDSALSAGAANFDFLDGLDAAGPFGTGFESFRFVMKDAVLSPPRKMGKDDAHLSLTISDATGRLSAVAFRATGQPLGDAIFAAADGRRVHVLGRLNRNEYRGRTTPQIQIDDVMFA